MRDLQPQMIAYPQEKVYAICCNSSFLCYFPKILCDRWKSVTFEIHCPLTEVTGDIRKPSQKTAHKLDMEASPTQTLRERKFVSPAYQRNGFALIATISILVLLALISVGLLSLSSVTIRTTGQNTAQMEARANARMALMIALGELQKQLGPDKRVNATSGIFDSDSTTSTIDGLSHNYLTGVWDSRDEDVGATPDYDRQDTFRRWLVSNEDVDVLNNVDFAENGTFDNPVTLLTASGGVTIEAGKVSSESGDGSYAWWVSDENSKARINPRNDLDRRGGLTTAEVVASTATPSPHGITGLPGFKNFQSNTAASDKLVSMDTLALMATPQVPKDHILDLTPYSESLLTNVKRGGLRQDLSLYFERDDINWQTAWGRAERARGFPQGPLGPNGKIALSPPAEYDVLGWKSLYHWYNMSRQIIPRGFFVRAITNNNAVVDKVSNPGWNSGVTGVRPVITRIQVLLSYGAVERSSRGTTNYEINFYRYPVITVWNPYNVPMQVPQYHVWLHTLPIENELFLDSNGAKGSGVRQYVWGRDQPNGGNSTLQFPSQFTLRPGEARTLVYSGPGSSGPDSHSLSQGNPSFSADNPGRSIAIWNSAATRTPVTENTKIIVATEDLLLNSDSDLSYRSFETTFGYRVEPKKDHQGGHSSRMSEQMFAAQVAWRREPGNPQDTAIVQENRPDKTIGEILDAPVPFLHLDVRLKTLDEARLPNKTWLHNIPSLPYAAATSTSKHSSDGVDSDTTFYAHPYTADFESVTTGEGIFQSTARFGSSNNATGQTFITDRELPLAPITSIAQLQNLPQYPIDALNWSGYYFQNHAIGNSMANPGLASDQIKQQSFPFYLGQYFHWQGGDLAGRTFQGTKDFNGEGYTPTNAPPLIVDRSYVANHLLWDDYYFSSLASQDDYLFNSQGGGNSRSITQVVKDFFSGEQPIPNGTLKPYLDGAGGVEATTEDLLAVGGGIQSDAYEKVSKYLTIEGGFNVNSTSVPAWKAVLGSMLRAKLAIIDTGGSGNKLEVETETDDDNPYGKYIVSRFTVPNAEGSEGNGGDKLWSGYRELTTTEIDELAEAIVEQVKERGPFRSIGEFVNRRLGSENDEKSLYGALQAALEDNDVSINSAFQNKKIGKVALGGASYPFEKAVTEGSQYQGTPAYVMQADLLNSFGPIINARSDTFTIRAYGEALAADGVTIEASAWCEAVVQRYPEYVDLADDPETEFESLTSKANEEFGRRFKIKSFRWLNQKEV